MGATLNGGSVRVLWDAATSATVTITNTSGAAVNFTVGGSAVTFPYTLASSTTFETEQTGAYTVSVKHQGFEIANTPDGTRPVYLSGGGQVSFAPTVDASPSKSDFLGDLSATYVARDGSGAMSGKLKMTGGTAGTERVEFGASADLALWRDTSFGFTQLRTSKPVRMSGFWLVEGDPAATGELNASAGALTNLAFLEAGVTSVSIRRPAGTGRLEFGQGDATTLTKLIDMDLSAAVGAVPLKVRGVVGQTGDLTRWEASDALGSRVYIASDRSLHVDDGSGIKYRLLASGGGLYFQHNAPLYFTDVNSGTPRMQIDTNGRLRWEATNAQTTVGAAGGASAPPATPTKYLKVVDSAGVTLVIPAYAAV